MGERGREKKNTSATSLHTSMCGCCFYVKSDFDVCESGPMAGAGCGAEVGVVERGPNEKIYNSGLLCLFTLSPSCLVGGGRQKEGGRRERERESGRPDLTGVGAGWVVGVGGVLEGHGCTSCQLCQETANHCSWFSGRFEGRGSGAALVMF